MQHITIYRQGEKFLFLYANDYGEGSQTPQELPNEFLTCAEELENFIDSIKTEKEQIFEYFIIHATDEEKLNLINMYPKFLIGKNYKVNDEFQYNDELYRIIQEHTSQEDWIPSELPALYLKVTLPGEIPNWIQPTGAHDAYQTGDKVKYEGLVYQSLIDNNTWSPTSYPAGWQLI